MHDGHLKLASFAQSELNLDRVIFVPSFETPLKDKKTLMSATQRLKLVKQAVKQNPRFFVSDYEIKKKGVSYTVDTLKYFKKKFGAGTTLYFLSGADTLKNIFRWKSLDEVLRLCCFVVVSRPGYRLTKKLPEAILLPMDALDVSSTEIRGGLSSNRIKK